MEDAALAAEYQLCQRCKKDVSHRLAFAFKSRGAGPPGSPSPTPGQSQSPGEVVKCATCALQHLPMLKRSAIAGVVVGSILTLLNQGDMLILGQWDNALYWKVPLTYCVPFLVATYGALANGRK